MGIAHVVQRQAHAHDRLVHTGRAARTIARCARARACSCSAICSARSSATSFRPTARGSIPGRRERSPCSPARFAGFWIFPFLLKYTGRYALLSFVSIQNLLFAILWGCYFYGGLSSPFLPWLVTVPLLAFFYLSASVKTCVTILLQITLSLPCSSLHLFSGDNSRTQSRSPICRGSASYRSSARRSTFR